MIHKKGDGYAIQYEWTSVYQGKKLIDMIKDERYNTACLKINPEQLKQLINVTKLKPQIVSEP